MANNERKYYIVDEDEHGGIWVQELAQEHDLLGAVTETLYQWNYCLIIGHRCFWAKAVTKSSEREHREEYYVASMLLGEDGEPDLNTAEECVYIRELAEVVDKKEEEFRLHAHPQDCFNEQRYIRFFLEDRGFLKEEEWD